MNLIFGMFSSILDFFADIGNRVDFMGLNLWGISAIVFSVSVIFRWLYPLVFGETASGGVLSVVGSVTSASADSVKKIAKTPTRLVRSANKTKRSG